MAVSLPYLASPGSIKTCLDKIKTAATPDRVTQDFVNTKLQIKGGTGAALIPYLKKIGFVASDGSPTEIYKEFRNNATSGLAVARAVRQGYSELAKVNEYFFELNDKDLLSLITQVTGAEAGNQVSKLTLSTLKTLKALADFDATKVEENIGPKLIPAHQEGHAEEHRAAVTSRRLNLSYTINLNLPAISDQSVFNAIFRSLKENLISDNE